MGNFLVLHLIEGGNVGKQARYRVILGLIHRKRCMYVPLKTYLWPYTSPFFCLFDLLNIYVYIYTII